MSQLCVWALYKGRSDGKRKMAFPVFARELGWVLCPGCGQAELIPALITWPWNQKYEGKLVACEVWATGPTQGSEFKSLLFFKSTAGYKIHSSEMWLQNKLHVLNKGYKKCELGDSLQNIGWKRPRNSWRMLGQSFVFEDGSGEPKHTFAPVCRDLRCGPPAACSVSPVPEACSHCGCILPSFEYGQWGWISCVLLVVCSPC